MLYTILYDELDSLHRAVLTKTVNAIHSFFKIAQLIILNQTSGWSAYGIPPIIESKHGTGNQITHGRVPLAVYQVDTRCLSQIKGNATSFQTDDKYGDVDVGHWIDNERISRYT